MPRPRRIVLLTLALSLTGCAVGADGVTMPGARESVVLQTQSPTVAPSTATVRIGQTVTLKVNKNGSNGLSLPVPTTWATMNGGVAIVSQAGVVTGVSPGVAVIVAVAGSSFANSTITVTP
jgi:uncharacterized protein YjdB